LARDKRLVVKCTLERIFVMTEKKTPSDQSNKTAKPSRDGALAKEDLDKVTGGINPQPLPPRDPPE